uniref:Uncharacterized protein n=1 Tax=Physcomitrium patens TaxID=3218 RepID=A0A7I3ZRK1_PHYPA
MVSIMGGVVVVSTTLQGVSVFPNSGAQSERVLLSTTHFFWSAATTSSMTCTVQNGKASDIYLTVTPCCDFHPDESSPLLSLNPISAQEFIPSLKRRIVQGGGSKAKVILPRDPRIKFDAKEES